MTILAGNSRKFIKQLFKKEDAMKLDIEFTYDGFKIRADVEAEFEHKTKTSPEYFNFDVLECKVTDTTGENREIDEYEYSRFESILSAEVFYKLTN